MTATAALNQACDDLTALLVAAHHRLDQRPHPTPRHQLEENSCGLCYERQAA